MKHPIPQIVREALISIKLTTNLTNVVIFNTKSTEDRRIKICNLPKASDYQIKKLQDALSKKLNVISVSKHKNYDNAQVFFGANALVVRLPIGNEVIS